MRDASETMNSNQACSLGQDTETTDLSREEGANAALHAHHVAEEPLQRLLQRVEVMVLEEQLGPAHEVLLQPRRLRTMT